MFYITIKLLEETMRDQRKILKHLPDAVVICSQTNNESNCSKNHTVFNFSNPTDIKFYN